MEPAFLQQRCQQLSLFLQVFLAHPLVKTCPLVPVYFKQHAHGDDSVAQIQNLVAYMAGKPISKAVSNGYLSAQIDHGGGRQNQYQS